MAYTTKQDKEELTQVDRYFQSALDHPTWVEWRKNALECFRYKEGDQWTKAELAVLKKRKQPPTVNNQVNVTINRMVGQFVKQRTRLGFRGRNSPDDTKTGEVLSDLFLFIRQNTNLEYEEKETAEDGFTGGFGVLETGVDFDDTFRPDIKITTEDPFSILPDPYSRRYDWNEDAMFVCKAKWMDVQEAKKLYPDRARELTGLLESAGAGQLSGVESFKKENYVDYKSERIRLVEIEYKETERQRLLFYGNGQTLDLNTAKAKEVAGIRAQFPDAMEIERMDAALKSCVFTAGIKLEGKTLPRKRFKWVPFFTSRKKSGEPFSLIHIALSVQDAINKRESKALHLLTTNQAMYEKSAVEDKALLAEEMAKPDGQMELRDGALANNRFQINKNIDLAVSQFQMHAESKNDFRRITGINPDALGERSEVRSGIGIARKQAMTDVIIAPVFDNFRRTRALLAKNVLELIAKYYTEEKIFTITDDLNAPKVVKLGLDTLEAIKQSIYDVVVEDLPDTTTTQQEQFQQLATTLPQILPFGPFWTTMLIQMSDIRNKDEIVKQIAAQSQPPPPEPKYSIALQWNELQPFEKAHFAAKLGMGELAQLEAQAGAEPAHITKAKTDLMKEGQKSEGEREKQQFEATKVGIELQGKQALSALDIQKKQMELAKAAMDIERARVDGTQGNQDSVQ